MNQGGHLSHALIVSAAGLPVALLLKQVLGWVVM